MIIVSFILGITGYILDSVSKVLLPYDPKNPFHDFYRYEENVNDFYIRMYISFSHALLAAAITGLSFGLMYRARLVLKDQKLAQELAKHAQKLKTSA